MTQDRNAAIDLAETGSRLPSAASFGWVDIIRLGLVQAALGSIVVLTTSTMNRIMVVELAFPAAIAGALVALHYAIQVLRPRLGHGSDIKGRRTPWIVGGVAVLALGAFLAAVGIWLAPESAMGALFVSLLAFVLIGLGVGASGTALLTLLAKGTHESRRAPAATTVWIMMIVGFIVTTAVIGQLLDPYSPLRLLELTAAVGIAAIAIAIVATWGIERRTILASKIASRASAPGRDESPILHSSPVESGSDAARKDFRGAFREVWAEPLARRFAFFVFVSMLAYSAQDLILEPFAGSVFAMTPGESTALSSVQHSGVLIGMLLVAVFARRRSPTQRDSLWRWAVAGCAASAAALFGLTIGAIVGAAWPLSLNVFLLGAANGAYAVAAIASMMNLVDKGSKAREGLRMGMWGAAQALAFGIGGFLGASASDVAQWLFASPALGYGIVFAIEGLLFVASGLMARRLAAEFAGEARRLATVDLEDTKLVNRQGAIKLQPGGA